MTDLLSASPLLTLFLTVGLGALLGAIPFGPVRLGAAGALFVGLLFGASADLGDALQIVSSLGLALFVYMVGLGAGQTFFKDLAKQAGLMGWAVLALILAAGGAYGVGQAFGLSPEIITGIFSGSLTATPALAAANSATGSGEPSVGYALGYPVGVIISILAVSFVVSRTWSGKNEASTNLVKDIYATTAAVENTIEVRKVHGYIDQVVKMSYLRRGGKTRVVSPGEELIPGDEVLLVGDKEAIETAIGQIGHEQPEHLANNRAHVDFRHFVVSAKDIAGRSVADLNFPARFGGVITRIRRGDAEFLARDEEILELGDRILAVVPSESLGDVRSYLGDSEEGVSTFSSLSVGVGMAIGLLVGMISISLPGGSQFSLGAAAGPLIVGMILGALHRTGPIIWQIPQAANQTIRQLGLLIFLTAVGIGAGPDFFEVVATRQGALSMVVAAVTVIITIAVLGIATRLSGLSAPRAAGAVSGVIGQPAILAFATSKVSDERIESGYAALFALAIVAKILLVHLILAF